MNEDQIKTQHGTRSSSVYCNDEMRCTIIYRHDFRRTEGIELTGDDRVIKIKTGIQYTVKSHCV